MRTSEQLLTEWDAIRRAIADGCTHSGPRDWFEGVIEEFEDAVRERDQLNSGALIVLPKNHAHAAAMHLVAERSLGITPSPTTPQPPLEPEAGKAGAGA
jgi:hypothetical protein